MKTLISVVLLLTILQGYGQKNMFDPSDEYINQNRGNSSIEIPEVQELIHVIIAISPLGQDNDIAIIDDKTEYFKEVVSAFETFKEHEIVKTVTSFIKKNTAYYYYLKMDGTGYFINNDGKIIKDSTYDRISWNDKNVIDPLLNTLQDFSNKSNFHLFFNNHKAFYENNIELMKSQSPIEKQWKWLETQFPDKYDNYRITFSPLTSGWHATQFFKTKNFSQIMMFVGGPLVLKKYNDKIIEGLVTRMVFTEIDHNYVNQISNKHKKEIKRIFSDKSKWTDSKKGTDWYGTPEAVFNEYMTWAVFTLYALDTFNAEDFKVINDKTTAQMIERRGFIKYKEFNEKLVDLYKNKKENETVVDLFPKIIDWCKGQ